MKKLLGKIIAFIGGLLIFSPIVYWANNPELTEMQIFIKFWYVFVLSIFALIIGFVMNSDDEHVF